MIDKSCSFLRQPLIRFDQRNPRPFDSAMGVSHSYQKLPPLNVQQRIVAFLPNGDFFGQADGEAFLATDASRNVCLVQNVIYLDRGKKV